MSAGVVSTLDPAPPPILRRPDRWRTPVARAVVAVVVLVVVGLVVRAHPVDAGLATSLNALHTGVFGSLCSAVYAVFEPVPAVLLTVVLTIVVRMRTGRLVVAAAFAGVVAVTWIPSDLLKLVVERPRPDGADLAHPFSPIQTDASFPSGHVAFVTALLLAASMLVADRRARAVLLTVGGLVVASIALALAVDGVHWPADVVASVVWSVAVAPAARLLWVDVVLRSFLRTPEHTGRHRTHRGEDVS